MIVESLLTQAFAAQAATWAVAGTALLVGALIGVSLLRSKTSAAQRHAVLVAAVVALLVLPVLGTTLPTWDLAPTIRIETPAITAVGSPAATTAGPTVEASHGASAHEEQARTAAPDAAQTVVGHRVRTQAPTSFSEPSTTGPIVAGPASAAEPAAAVVGLLSTPAMAFADSLSTSLLILGFWGLGVLGIVTWMGVGVAARTVVFGRGTTDVRDPRLILQLASAREAMGVGRTVRLRWSESARIPATWGSIRPIIVLPTAAAEWGREQQQAALLHEMAHVARFDHLLQTVSRIACALHWFNPLVWRTARRVSAEAEHACDDRAIAASSSPTAYARELINVARTLRANAPLRMSATVAMARTSELEHRVEAILDRARSRQRPSKGLSLGVVGATIVIAGVLAVGMPRFEEVSAQENAVDVRDAANLVAMRSGSNTQPFFELAEPTSPIEPTLQEAPCLPGSSGRGSLTEVVNGRDDHIEVFWDTGRCNVTIRLEGVRFNANETDVASIEGGGQFRIEQEGLGPDRRLDVAEEAGELRYRYREDGREVAYDASAQAWLADMIPTIFRVTGLQADERIDRLMARGGAEAVLEEVRLIHSDHTAGIYLQKLMAIEDLSEDDLMTAFQLAGANIDSDHELSKILQAGWRPGLSGPARQSFLEAAQGVSSDHELSEVLQAFLEVGISQADVISLLGLTSTIESDHALAKTLRVVIETVESGPDVAEAVLEAAQGIASDHELSLLLQAMHEQMPDGLVTNPRFFELAGSLGSDHELANVLRAVVEGDLTEAQLVAVIEAAQTIGSDHEHATLLRDIVEAHAPMSDTLRRRLIAAAESIGSDYERDRTLAEIARSTNR